MKQFPETFWEKVDKTSECWNWTASCKRGGYGQFWLGGVNQTAHRVAWFLEHGEWPKNLLCHRCDNPKCVRPSHCFEGTHLDNTRDMDAKGRRNTSNAPRGSRHPNAKISEETVRAMREEYAKGDRSKVAVGRMYGVKKSMAGYILKGDYWRHVG